jgi:hypothetical protein
MINFREVIRMVVAKPRDSCWTCGNGFQYPVMTTITFQRRFYFISDTNLVVLDMVGGLPRLVLSIVLHNSIRRDV